MGTYAQVGDVRAVLAREDADPTGTAASLDDPRIEEGILSAEQEVNAALAADYKVPFASPVPDLVSDVTRDIAAYLCDLVYRQQKDYDSENEPILLRYKRAKEMLKALSEGKYIITVAEGEDAVPELKNSFAIRRNEGQFFHKRDFALRKTIDREGNFRYDTEDRRWSW